MTALDDFMTRARLQNDSHHNERLRTLGIIMSRLRTTTRSFEQTQANPKRFLKDLWKDGKRQMLDLEGLVEAMKADTEGPLLELRQELSDNIPDRVRTNRTNPQKREWNYPTQLPRTAEHEVIIAKLRGLPDPTLTSQTPASARTPARSPRKQASPRKGPASPSKIPSPSKTRVFTDIGISKVHQPSLTTQTTSVTTTTIIPLSELKSGGLKEMDINVINSNKPLPAPSTTSSQREEKPVLLDFSKSVGSGCQTAATQAACDSERGSGEQITGLEARPGRQGLLLLGQGWRTSAKASGLWGADED